MKKDFLKGILVGCLFTISVGGTLAFASPIKSQIEAVYNDIKINIDKNQIVPKDANGNIVEPFISNGTTYLPVRAIADALGKTVNWDSATNTVYINSNDSNISAVQNSFTISMLANAFNTNSTYISNSFTYNNKIYVPLDEIVDAFNYREYINPDTHHISISNRLFESNSIYSYIKGTKSNNAYSVIIWQPSDNINDMAGAHFFIDINALTDAGFSRRVIEQDNGTFNWEYSNSNSTASPNFAPSFPSNFNTGEDKITEREKYKSELNAINAKYDAMIDIVRSSSVGTSSLSVTATAQQIQQYEQQRQNEIDALNAKYGY